MGCDAEDIALTIHAHPTLHESVGLAAEVFEGSNYRSSKIAKDEEKINLNFNLFKGCLFTQPYF